MPQPTERGVTSLETVEVTASRTFQFPVESGQVLQFARAVGEIDLREAQPMYVDVAMRTPPPTFLVAADVFDPISPRRPYPGEAFPGSGELKQPIDRGEPRRRGFHAQQTFEFRRQPRIGEVLAVETGIGRSWIRSGSTGQLNFTEHISRFTDFTGQRVATSCWLKVMVGTSTKADMTPPKRAARPLEASSADGTSAVRKPETNPNVADDSWSEVVAPTVTLTHLVMYAGASGDYIPMHHDDRIATAAGYPGVFAHGMWTMGVSARAFSRAVATDNLRRYSARMHSPVMLGDTLTAEVVRTPSKDGAPADQIALKLVTRNQRGQLVLSADVLAQSD
jgi:acyl dehydratase